MIMGFRDLGYKKSICLALLIPKMVVLLQLADIEIYLLSKARKKQFLSCHAATKFLTDLARTVLGLGGKFLEKNFLHYRSVLRCNINHEA